MAKLKTISFEDQLALMAEKHGVPSEDAVNVFSAYRKTIDEIISTEVDVGSKNFELLSPFGVWGVNWVDASKRVSSSGAIEYEAPARYVFNYAYPVWLITTANKNVDFSNVPSSSEVAAAKVAPFKKAA